MRVNALVGTARAQLPIDGSFCPGAPVLLQCFGQRPNMRLETVLWWCRRK